MRIREAIATHGVEGTLTLNLNWKTTTVSFWIARQLESKKTKNEMKKTIAKQPSVPAATGHQRPQPAQPSQQQPLSARVSRITPSRRAPQVHSQLQGGSTLANRDRREGGGGGGIQGSGGSITAGIQQPHHVS